MELFSPTILRNFPLKKSDFLGIFKNVLTGFYCTLSWKDTYMAEDTTILLLFLERAESNIMG
jgi:hypothetical protein